MILPRATILTTTLTHVQHLLHLPQRLAIRLDSQGQSVFTGTCRVRWFKTPSAEYTFKTRKRDILALMLAGDRSLGQWVNCHQFG